MAIIQAPSGPGLTQTLLEILVNKEQINLQKEQQKLAQGQLKIQQEAAAQQAAEVAARNEAGAALLQALQGDPRFAELVPQDISAGGAAALAPQLMEVVETSANLNLLDEQTQLAAEELRQNRDLFGLRQRELEANIEAAEAAEENSRREAQFRERFFTFQKTQAAQETAMSELQNFRDYAAVVGPVQASRQMFGTDTPPPPTELASRRLQEIEGIEAPEELVDARLTRAAGTFMLPENSVTQLREALTEAGGDPQAVLNEVLSQNLDEATQATFYAVLRSAFPNASLSLPPKQAGPIMRFLRSMFSASGGTMSGAPSAGARPPARPSGG